MDAVHVERQSVAGSITRRRLSAAGSGAAWSDAPYAVRREPVRDLPRDPVIDLAGPVRDFAVTLSDGRRVVGNDRDGDWSVYVYGDDGRLLGYGAAATRLNALEHAGLSGEHAGEVLGRSGI